MAIENDTEYPLDRDQQETAVRNALREVIDPEVGISIIDLGLVESIEINGQEISVQIIPTTPACPLGPVLRDQSVAAIRKIFPDAHRVEVDILRDILWTPERMNQSAREELFGG